MRQHAHNRPEAQSSFHHAGHAEGAWVHGKDIEVFRDQKVVSKVYSVCNKPCFVHQTEVFVVLVEREDTPPTAGHDHRPATNQAIQPCIGASMGEERHRFRNGPFKSIDTVRFQCPRIHDMWRTAFVPRKELPRKPKDARVRYTPYAHRGQDVPKRAQG